MIYQGFQLWIFHLRQETQINIELLNGFFIQRKLSDKAIGLFVVEQITPRWIIKRYQLIVLKMDLMLVDEFGIQNDESLGFRYFLRLILSYRHFPQNDFLKLTLRGSTYSLERMIFA